MGRARTRWISQEAGISMPLTGWNAELLVALRLLFQHPVERNGRRRIGLNRVRGGGKITVRLFGRFRVGMDLDHRQRKRPRARGW